MNPAVSKDNENPSSTKDIAVSWVEARNPTHCLESLGFASRLGQMNFIFTKVGSSTGKSGHFSRVLQENILIVGNISHNSLENVHLTQSVRSTQSTLTKAF